MPLLRKPGLLVGGSYVRVEALVNPVAFAKEVHLAPSAGDRTEPGMAWQCSQQGLRLGTTRRFAALQHIDGLLGDRNAAVLDPEHRESREIRDEEEGEVWRSLADEYLPDLATRAQERG